MFRSLLRLLLCLCLLADTLGPAVAATHLAMAQAGAQDAVAGGGGATPGPADADCHGLQQMADMAPRPVVPATRESCLERCLDLCLQHGSAALPATPLPPACGIAWLPARVADAQVDAVHAAPLLRRPIA